MSRYFTNEELNALEQHLITVYRGNKDQAKWRTEELKASLLQIYNDSKTPLTFEEWVESDHISETLESLIFNYLILSELVELNKL